MNEVSKLDYQNLISKMMTNKIPELDYPNLIPMYTTLLLVFSIVFIMAYYLAKRMWRKSGNTKNNIKNT